MTLWIFIRYIGSDLSNDQKIKDKKLAQPVLVTVYPVGKPPSTVVFIPYTKWKKPSVTIGVSNGK